MFLSQYRLFVSSHLISLLCYVDKVKFAVLRSAGLCSALLRFAMLGSAYLINALIS